MFFMVLDLRLVKDWLSGDNQFFLFLVPCGRGKLFVMYICRRHIIHFPIIQTGKTADP